MISGNISNKSTSIIAFNIDTLLFTDKVANPATIPDKIIDFFTLDALKEKREYFNREVNNSALSTIMKVWRKTDYGVYLVTFKPYLTDIEKFLYEEVQFQCYNRIVSYENLDELKPLLLDGRYSLYVDSSYSNILHLGGTAIHIDSIEKYLKI